MKNFILISILWHIAFIVAHGQRPVPEEGLFNNYDNETRDLQIEKLLLSLSDSESGKPALINGKEFFPWYYRSKSKPLLFNGTGYTASVKVEEREYENISLLYDTYSDQLIYSDTSRLVIPNDIQLIMNSNIVESFKIIRGSDTLSFVNLKPEINTDGPFSGGYLEKLLNNSDRFYVRHRSVVYEKNGIDEYYYRPVLLINKGNAFETVKNSKQFIRYFTGLEDDVRAELQKGNKDFNPLNRDKITALIMKYNSHFTE